MAIKQFSDMWNNDELRPMWRRLKSNEKQSLFYKFASNKLKDNPKFTSMSDDDKDKYLDHAYKKMISSEPSYKWDDMAGWKKPFHLLNQAVLQGGLGTSVMAAINENIEGHEQYSGNVWKAVKEGFFQEQGPVTGGDFFYKWGWRPKSNAGKFAREALGFVAWTLVDPTTWFTMNSLTKAGKAALRTGQVAQGARSLEIAQKGLALGRGPLMQAKAGQRALLQWAGLPVIKGEKLYKHLTPILSKLKDAEKFKWAYRLFNNTPLDPKLGKIYKEARNAQLKLLGMVEGEADEIAGKVFEFAKKNKRTPMDVMGDMVESFIMKKPMGNELDDVNKVLKGKFMKWHMEEMKRGVGAKLGTAARAEIDELGKMLKAGKNVVKVGGKNVPIAERVTFLQKGLQQEYFPFVLDRKTAQALGGNGYTASKEFSAANKFAKTRKYFGYGIRDVNKYMSELPLDKVGKQRFQKWFSENIAYAYNIRGRSYARATTNADMLMNARKTFGRYIPFTEDLDDIFKNGKLRRIDGNGFEMFRDRNGVWALPNDIAEELTRASNVMTGKDALQLGGVFKAVNAVSNVWKPHLLAWRPGYYVRNMVGNMTNAFYAGVTNPAMHVEGAVMALRGRLDDPALFASGGKKALLKEGAEAIIRNYDMDKIIKGSKYTRRQAYELAKEHGLLRVGQYTSDVAAIRMGDVEKLSDKGIRKAVRTAADAISGRKLLEAGSTIEDGSKLAIFINELKKGSDPFQASEWAKKFLFDYGDIGPLDQKIRHVAWFWTWTRKNIPLQLEMAITKPGQSIGLIQKARKESSGATPEFDIESESGRSFMPQYLYDKMPMRLGPLTRNKRGQIVGTYMPLENWIPTADLVKLTGANRMKQAFVEMINPIYKTMIEVGVMGKVVYTGRDIKEYKGQRSRFLGADLPVNLVYGLRNLSFLNEINKVTGKYSEDEIAEIGEKPLDSMSKKEKAAWILAGIRMYKYDLNDMQRYFVYNIKGEVRAIRRDAQMAAKNGNMKEAQRLVDLAGKVAELDLEKLSVGWAKINGVLGK